MQNALAYFAKVSMAMKEDFLIIEYDGACTIKPFTVVIYTV